MIAHIGLTGKALLFLVCQDSSFLYLHEFFREGHIFSSDFLVSEILLRKNEFNLFVPDKIYEEICEDGLTFFEKFPEGGVLCIKRFATKI